MSQPVVDTLQLCDALRKTGMEREQAEGVARALGDQLGAHVVAQGDLQTGFLELRGEIQSVDHRVDLARTELVGQIRILDGRIDALDGKVDSVKTELGGRIDQLKTELDGKVDSVRTELGTEFGSLQTTLRIVGGGVALLLAALGFVAANAVLGKPAPTPWHTPPPQAVSAPTVGEADRTPMP